MPLQHAHQPTRLLVSLLALGMALGSLPATLPARADTFFPQTNANVWGPFEIYWRDHGGLAQFGMPRTSVFPSAAGYDAQWFERAMFTYNPRNPDPFKVELQLLGNMVAPKVRAVKSAYNDAFKPTGGGAGSLTRYFNETQHNLQGQFLTYWQNHGGVVIYGYPISEAFMETSKSDGKQYLVQYFERNRFELHPELAGTAYEVQLGLLGSELLDMNGGPTAFANKGNPLSYPPPTKVGEIVPPGGVIQPPGAPGGGGAVTIPDAPPLPATTGAVLYQNNFSSPDLSAWENLAPFASAGTGPASWRVVSGRLEQSGIADQDGSDDAAFLVTHERGYSNFTMDAYYYATSGEPVGVVFRYSDSGFYMVRLYPSGLGANELKASLYKMSGGQGIELASNRTWTGYSQGKWQRITVTANGQSLKVVVDGATLLDATDSKFASGGVGFYAYADGSAQFDNLRVTR